MILNGDLPAFEISAGGYLLSAARSLFVAALLSMFGTVVFLSWVVTIPIDQGRQDRWQPLLRLFWCSFFVATVFALVWAVLATRSFVGGGDVPAVLSMVPGILRGTDFGRIVVCQILCLFFAAVTIGNGTRPRRRICALGLLALATILQMGHGHALAMSDGPSILMVSEAVHLLCAGAWLGGLLPLFCLIRASSPGDSARAAERFSRVGKICVIGIALSAATQGLLLIGDVPGLIGSAYGWLALAKLTLFMLLLGLAALNRYRFTPALSSAESNSVKTALLRNIAIESALGGLVIGVASLLISLPPAIHSQPVWPFMLQPSLNAIREEPAFRDEVLLALAALILALALLIAAVVVRRTRRTKGIAVVLAGGLAVWAFPHFDLLFIEAHSTSFYRSPTGFSAVAIADGAALYRVHCVACHGSEGQGDGPSAAALPVPPADLTAGHLWAHDDGEMFWWLSEGIKAPDGSLVMPGFSGRLSEDERWNLIDFIRAHNAGFNYEANQGWPQPLQSPGFQAKCSDGQTLASDDLRGRVIRLVFVGDHQSDWRIPSLSPPKGADIVTVLAAAQSGLPRPNRGECVIEDLEFHRSYEIVAGTAAGKLAGSQFLIDRDGWLRAMLPYGAGDMSKDENNAELLFAELDTITANPIRMSSQRHSHHH